MAHKLCICSINDVLGCVDLKWTESERRTHTLAQCLSRARDLTNTDTSTLLSPSQQLLGYSIHTHVHVHVYTCLCSIYIMHCVLASKPEVSGTVALSCGSASAMCTWKKAIHIHACIYQPRRIKPYINLQNRRNEKH